MATKKKRKQRNTIRCPHCERQLFQGKIYVVVQTKGGRLPDAVRTK